MADDEARFYFCIPLRSRASTKDWPRIVRLLGDTLRSVFAQTDKRFEVILACQDVPDLPELADPRVTVLTTEAPTPTTFEEGMRDKGRKKRMMGVEVGRRGGGYIMLVDADDLVSNRLVEHVLKDDNRRGYLIRDGYMLDTDRRLAKSLPDFDQRCGSCAVFYLRREDLPTSVGDDSPTFFAQIRSHMEWRQHMATGERALDSFPFPASVYVVNYGDNASLALRSMKFSNFHYRFDALIARIASRRLMDQIAAEFAVPARYLTARRG